MLTKGGFTLTKFVSIVRGVLSTLNRMENPATGNVKALVAEDDSSNVLGLEWNYRFDTLDISRGTTPDRISTLTLRVLLSLVSAVYDPIGLVAPYTGKARLLLKDNWRLSGQQWDDNLPDHIVDKFVAWIEELTKLNEVTILRSYFVKQAEKIEIHVFGNNSHDVFLSVVFLRRKATSGSQSGTEPAFVLGRARVLPKKPLTIPMLELQAALPAARLGNKIQLALTTSVERTFMWTHSTTVLH